MFVVLQVVTVILVSVAFALALAHALELPGKMRLDKQTYLAVQPIYYPGFTLGAGVGEAGGIAATLILLLLTPSQTPAFALTLAALVGLLSMHAAYWIFTHPLNKFWVERRETRRVQWRLHWLRSDAARRTPRLRSG